MLPTAPTASLAAALAADGLSLARLTRAAALPGQGAALDMVLDNQVDWILRVDIFRFVFDTAENEVRIV